MIFNFLKKFRVILICGLVVIILFWPFFRNGKVPVAFDIPVGMYYPWLNYNYGYPVRPPVRNPLLTDTISQFWIWRNWAMDGLKTAKINIWNPYSFSGYSMSPWFHTMLLSPINIFYFITDNLTAMGLIVVSQIVIALAGCYVLGKRWWKSEISAWCLSLGFTLSSFFVGWLTWGSVSLGLALMPWFLWLGDKILDQEAGRLKLFFYPIIGALIIFSGHPQTILYIFLIAGIFTLSKIISIKKLFVKVTLKQLIRSWLIIGGLSAVVLLPSIRIISDSIRSLEDGMVGINYGFISLWNLILNLVSPNFFGNPGTNNYWGSGHNYQEKLVYFGIIILFLALYQIVKKPKDKEDKGLRLAALTCIIVGLLLSIKYPVGILPYYLKLPLISTSPAGRSFIISIFGACILAAMTIKEWVDLKTDKDTWRLAIIMIITIVMATITALGMGWGWEKAAGVELQTYLAGSYSHISIAIRNCALSFGLVMFSIFGVILGNRFKKLRKVLAILIIGLNFADGYYFFKKYTPFVDRNLYLPVTGSINYLQKQTENSRDFFRIERESAELLPPNLWQHYLLPSTSGYDPINPKSYNDYLIDKKTRETYSRYIENGVASINNINDLGVKYLLVLKRDNGLNREENGIIPDWVDEKQWHEVQSEGRVVVLENKLYQPPYQWIQNNENNQINLISKNDTYWKFSAQTTHKNKFVLFENYTPEWSVKVNGIVAKTEIYDGTFKMVETEEGKHIIEFFYDNRLWKIGVGVSFLSLIMLVFGQAVKKRPKYDTI